MHQLTPITDACHWNAHGHLQALQRGVSDGSTDSLVFNINDNVLVKNFYGQPKWLSGSIVQRNGPVSFKVNADGVIMRRHLDQMRTSDPAIALSRNTLREPVAPNTEPHAVCTSVK